MAKSKRYLAALAKVPGNPVSLVQAIEIVKSFDATKFDATINLAIHLGIDPKQADQGLRGSISLPHGIGRSRKVIAFCDDSQAEAAKAAGAIEAGGESLVKKVSDGWTDFDVAVAHPSMMRMVSKLGRVLGPQGKMPSPKAGTVSEDVLQAVKEYSAGKVEYRNDDGGNLHVPVGKISFDSTKLVENIEALLTHVRRIRPSSAKGIYIKKVALAATMSPSILVDVA